MPRSRGNSTRSNRSCFVFEVAPSTCFLRASTIAAAVLAGYIVGGGGKKVEKHTDTTHHHYGEKDSVAQSSSTVENNEDYKNPCRECEQAHTACLEAGNDDECKNTLQQWMDCLKQYT